MNVVYPICGQTHNSPIIVILYAMFTTECCNKLCDCSFLEFVVQALFIFLFIRVHTLIFMHLFCFQIALYWKLVSNSIFLYDKKKYLWYLEPFTFRLEATSCWCSCHQDCGSMRNLYREKWILPCGFAPSMFQT